MFGGKKSQMDQIKTGDGGSSSQRRSCKDKRGTQNNLLGNCLLCRASSFPGLLRGY